MELGERIKECRERVGLSQSELARRLGLNRVNVSSWESGAYKPALENLAALAEHLQTTADHLLGVAPVSEDSPAPGWAVRLEARMEAMEAALRRLEERTR